MKEGFCLNSRKWLRFIFITPRTCPYHEEQMNTCEVCGYYEERKLSIYAKRKMKQIKLFYKDG